MDIDAIDVDDESVDVDDVGDESINIVEVDEIGVDIVKVSELEPSVDIEFMLSVQIYAVFSKHTDQRA